MRASQVDSAGNAASTTSEASITSTKGKVPLVADFMASRWAYEALAVDAFKNNSYEKP